MFLSAIELSSSYILPLQTTDKIGPLPPSGMQDKWITYASSVVRKYILIVLFWFSCYVSLLFGGGVKVIPKSVCVQQESVHLPL